MNCTKHGASLFVEGQCFPCLGERADRAEARVKDAEVTLARYRAALHNLLAYMSTAWIETRDEHEFEEQTRVMKEARALDDLATQDPK